MADIDDLKATFEQVVTATSLRDASAYSALWREQVVAFSPFALEGKPTLRQAAETNFANAESVDFSPISPQCRVVGSTGIVWGHTALTIQCPRTAHSIRPSHASPLSLPRLRRSDTRWRCTFHNFRRETEIGDLVTSSFESLLLTESRRKSDGLFASID